MHSTAVLQTDLRNPAELIPHPDNPRGEIDADAPEIVRLSEDIVRRGLIQPIVITPDGKILAGHRRRIAAIRAGLELVPVVIRTLEKHEFAEEFFIAENMQRQDLSPLEEAVVINALHLKLEKEWKRKVTQADLARRLDMPSNTVGLRLLILKLPERVQKLFHLMELPLNSSRELHRLVEWPDEVEKIADKIVMRQITLKSLNKVISRRLQMLRDGEESAEIIKEYEPIREGISVAGRTNHRHESSAAELTRGLQRFHTDFGFCALSSETYALHQQFTGRDHNGNHSNRGYHQKYPSYHRLLQTWRSVRDAWRAAGFDVNAGYQEWSAVEDWFVLESVGILPRTEVAAILKRTGPAIKRRLYDLGDIRANNRWGISITGASHLMGVPDVAFRKYINKGIIPVFRGYKIIYLNPADLPSVAEFNWAAPDIDPKLETLVRRALIQRACKILKFGEKWRDHEIYKFEKRKSVYLEKNGCVRTRFLGSAPLAPNDLAVGDWIKTTYTEFGRAGRVGLVKAVFYSWLVCERRDGTRRACWIARIEFPRLRGSAVSNDKRINYTLPLDCLERTVKPHIEPKPLSMHPDAVRGRQRFVSAVKKARERFTEIKGELS